LKKITLRLRNMDYILTNHLKLIMSGSPLEAITTISQFLGQRSKILINFNGNSSKKYKFLVKLKVKIYNCTDLLFLKKKKVSVPQPSGDQLTAFKCYFFLSLLTQISL